MRPKIVLTIAGSDSCGGAGIQADLKTIAAHGCYGMSAITALTAQNTRGVAAVHTPPARFLAAQLESVLSDFPPDAIKIGMLPDAACVRAVVAALREYQKRRRMLPVVLDPVMAAASGAPLADEDAVAVMQRELFPYVTLVTPNLREAEALSGMCIASQEDMEAAAPQICHTVLLKGGHRLSQAQGTEDEGADDLLWYEGKLLWLRGRRVDAGETHGTGCTLSSAIACRMAQGHALPEAAKLAKGWLSWLLADKPEFGVPNSPLLHR